MASITRLKSKPVRLALLALLGFVLFSAMTLRLFVFPDLGAPARSDAIVVLGGAPGGTAEAIKLAQEGYAPTVAFSADSCTQYVPNRRDVHVVCFKPHPGTTQGEARWIGQMAAREHWNQIIVVVRRTQATRARLRIERCYPGRILEVGIAPTTARRWLYDIVYEWGALGKALVLQRSC